MVAMLVLEEHLLVAQVSDEGDGGDAEARERALEPVPAREHARVAPGLTVYVATPNGSWALVSSSSSSSSSVLSREGRGEEGGGGGWLELTIAPMGRSAAGPSRRRTCARRNR